MADGLMAALQSKLVAYQSAGMTDHVKAVKARIAQLEKGPKKAAAPVSAPATLSTTVTTTTVTAPKKAAKKAAAKKRK